MNPLQLRWWGYTGVTRDGYRVVVIRLPSWGMGYYVNDDEERWGQRTLIYHGRDLFSMGWYFPPEPSGPSYAWHNSKLKITALKWPKL